MCCAISGRGRSQFFTTSYLLFLFLTMCPQNIKCHFLILNRHLSVFIMLYFCFVFILMATEIKKESAQKMDKVSEYREKKGKSYQYRNQKKNTRPKLKKESLKCCKNQSLFIQFMVFLSFFLFSFSFFHYFLHFSTYS